MKGSYEVSHYTIIMWQRSIIGVDDTTDLIGTTRFHSFFTKNKG